MRCLNCNKYLRSKSKRKGALYCSSRCRTAAFRKRKRYRSETDNSEKTILSLCDYSGNWSEPYRQAGYSIIRADMELNGMDIRFYEYSDRPVYGILAAPPCTCFSVAGVSHARSRQEMIEALSVVDACLRLVTILQPNFWALENPVGTLRKYLGPPNFYFQPCDYGDAYTKRTCLWGNFNKPAPTKPVKVKQVPRSHLSIDHYWRGQGVSVGKHTKRLRSITPMGFAQAFFEVNK